MIRATLPWEGALTRPMPPYMAKLIRDVFTGHVTNSDLVYMAKAILQMSDEIAELRERMRAMELAFKAVENDGGRG